jgi:hypothetical protein
MVERHAPLRARPRHDERAFPAEDGSVEHLQLK